MFLFALLAAPQMIWGQTAIGAHPVARVQQRIDNAKRAALGGHMVPALRHAADLGRLSGSAAMNHMVMVLQPSPEQNHALQSLLDQQLDSGHANFHKWMTPEQFGTQFGVADADIAQVTSWLTQQGFAVENVSPSKRFIQFSGNVGQVEFAFKTEMHRYNVHGAIHVANSTDISVPAALKPVISGVPTLHDFFKKSSMADTSTINAAPKTGKVYEGKPYKGTPDYTSGSTHYLGAGDFATVYNTNPLLTAGNDGTGVSIGIIGRTDINMADVQIYRTFFKLKDNDPTFVVAGEDPGFVGGDDGESYLDVEVSGGAAPGAAVKFVTSRATLTTDGVDLAAMYTVQNNLTDVISESYGQCEADFTPAQAAFYSNLWAQAAAQGQSVFVSSGDNGPAGCEDSNNTFETTGYAVSLLASSPYNVAVGGTLFADTTGGPYWGTTATSTPPFSSALGYIPEVPWNEAKGSGASGASGLWSGSGGISSYFVTPSWQHGFGVPATDPAYVGNNAVVSPSSPFVSGPHRYLPDVAMAAASGHDGTLYCAEGVCQLSSTGTLTDAGIVGGTSVAAPTMAGVQALIDQYNGGRQGLPNYVYYALADNQHTAGLNCAANSGASMNSQCAFHDVTTGNILICGNSGCTAANKIGWTAAPGYDLATGLGSPNAANLAHLWSTVAFRSSTTSMNLSQTTGITHGQAVTVSGIVAPGSGAGTPTGNVAFIVSSGALGDPMNASTGGFQNQVSLGTLDGSGHYSVSVANLPAGTYYVTARYSGDGIFASSVSSPVPVTVAAESAGVTIQANAFNGTTCIETPATTFTYGSYIWTDFTVSGGSGQGVPTGTVSITDNSAALTTTPLNPTGVAHTLSGAIASTSCVSGYTFQDVAPPTGGTHIIGATYSGDGSFNSMTATPITVTITPATVPGALTTSTTNINAAGATVQLTFTLTGLSGAGPRTLSPTGTVTFTDTTTSSVLGTATLNGTSTFGARAVLSTTAITAAGANSITASWPGDNNYNAVTSGAVTVTVQSGTATSVTVTSNTNPAAVGGRPTFTATMSPTTVTSGTVNFYDGTTLLGSGTVGSAHTATFRPAASVNLPAGVHSITAYYAGNATFSSSVSPVFSQTFNPAATTIALTVKSAGIYGDSFGLSAVLGTTISGTPPSGTITFFDGATQLGSPVSMAFISTAAGGYGLYQAVLQQSLAAGTHTITAQLTDSSYTAPTSNSQTITVSKATATIALTNTVQTYTGSPLAVTATTTPAALTTVTITYTGTGSTTYGPSTTAPTNAGTYAVSATLNNANYTATQTGTLTINKANQTLTFTGLPSSGIYGSAGPYTLNGSASSILPVSYTVSGPGSVSGSILTITGPGTVSVTASQAGNVNYNAATSVTQVIVVSAGTQQLVTTAVLSKTASGYQAVVTVVNNGTGNAQNVQLTAALLGAASGTPIPAAFGEVAHGGGSASVTITFPSSAGTSGAGVVEKLTGTYTGGTFTGSFRAMLPN